MPAAADRTSDSSAAQEPSRTDAQEPTAAAPEPSAAPGDPLFREHLFPGIGMWIGAVLLGGALGLVVVPVHLPTAIVLAVVCIIALLVLVHQYSPVLEVTSEQFRLARARIDVELLGEAQVLRDEEWGLTIGQNFEPLAHHCVRGWTRSGIRVEVLDEQDPTTAWVASTRRPEDLALALRTAQQVQQRRSG